MLPGVTCARYSMQRNPTEYERRFSHVNVIITDNHTQYTLLVSHRHVSFVDVYQFV